MQSDSLVKRHAMLAKFSTSGSPSVSLMFTFSDDSSWFPETSRCRLTRSAKAAEQH